MAKNLSYERNTTETLKVKGNLSDDAKYIVYLDEDKDEQIIEVQQLLNNFCSMPIEISLKKAEKEELDLCPEDEFVPEDAVED